MIKYYFSIFYFYFNIITFKIFILFFLITLFGILIKVTFILRRHVDTFDYKSVPSFKDEDFIDLQSYYNDQNNFHMLIGKLYINNIYVTLMKAFIYLFIHFFIFIILRIYMLGNERELFFTIFNDKNFYLDIILIILFILCYMYFIKITNIKLYTAILQLHIYLQGNKKYIKIEDKYKEYAHGFFKEKLINFSLIISEITEGTKRKSWLKFTFLRAYYTRYTRKLLVIIKKYLRTNKKMRNRIIKIDKFIFWTDPFRFIWACMTAFLYYLPFVILFLAFLFDVFFIGNFYYINFALLIVILTGINKRINRFFYEKDPVLDKFLYVYLYEKNEAFMKTNDILKKKSEINDINEFNNQIHSTRAYLETEELPVYIKENFRVYYAVEREETFTQYNTRVLRWILCIIYWILSSFLLINSDKYIFKIANLVLPSSFMILLLCIPLLVMLLTRNHIAEEYEDWKWKYNYKNKILFYLSVAIQGIIFSILLLKSKFLFLPQDCIWDYGIIIIENFTINEKILYIYNYLEIKLNESSLTLGEKKVIINSLLNINYLELININTTIKNLKEYIDNIIICGERLAAIHTNFPYILEIDIIKNIETKEENILNSQISVLLLLASLILTYLTHQKVINKKLIEYPPMDETYIIKEVIKILWNLFK